MKTFIVLFVIAVSLPADAQRVRENIRQRSGITAVSQSVESESVKAQSSTRGQSQNNDTKRKR